MNARLLKPTFWDLFTPKLVTVLLERYRLADLRADIIAGLTVAIVAIPLSMAIAIASGVTPDRGLYTAIVGGFFVSLLGGSRFQIGGPAGAFIVLVAATVATHGIDGLIWRRSCPASSCSASAFCGSAPSSNIFPIRSRSASPPASRSSSLRARSRISLGSN